MTLDTNNDDQPESMAEALRAPYTIVIKIKKKDGEYCWEIKEKIKKLCKGKYGNRQYYIEAHRSNPIPVTVDLKPVQAASLGDIFKPAPNSQETLQAGDVLTLTVKDHLGIDDRTPNPCVFDKTDPRYYRGLAIYVKDIPECGASGQDAELEIEC